MIESRSSLSLSFYLSISISPSPSSFSLRDFYYYLIHSCRNLSKRLSSLRDRRSSMTSSGNQQKDSAHPPSGNSLPGAAATNSAAAATTEEPLSVEEKLRKRNAYLQGRVDVLQQQNRQLGHCIHELKSFTDMVSL